MARRAESSRALEIADPVLVTGAPGLVAQLAVRALLARGADVIALEDPGLRSAPTPDLAAAPMRGPARRSAGRGRLRVLTGRLSGIDLGLSGAEIGEVASSARTILHWVNEPDSTASAARHRGLHVDSTREILRLALECPKLERLSLWSSAWVSSGQGRVLDEGAFDPSREASRPYEHSKHEAERLVRASRDTLPICVFRPTVLFGDAETGASAPGWPTSHLVRLFAQWPFDFGIPVPGDCEVPFHSVPASFAVEAGLHLLAQPTSIGRTFHLTDPRPPTARRALALMAEWTGAPPPLHLPLPIPPRWLSRLSDRVPLRGVAVAQREFLERVTRPVVVDAEAAWTYLSGSGLTCPVLEDYGPRVVAALSGPAA